jgi:hypothetical protein
MNEICLYLIMFIHVICILFIIVVPFTNNLLFLLLHSIIVPFMIFHWILNNNTCALTLMEQSIRCKLYGTYPNSNECFIGNIIEPIYDVTQNHKDLSSVIYISAISLWLISLSKLYCIYKENKKTYLSNETVNN